MPKVPSLLLLLVGSTLALAALHAPSPPSLSPADWPPGALAGLMEYSSYFGPHPETNLTCPANLQCNRGGVVSGSSNVLAEYAGYFAYLRGGNAIDACLVTAITQTVLAANSWVNVGGIADIVFVNGSTGASQTIYGVWGRPSEAQQAALNSRHIGGTVLIGGFLSAVEAASAAFGQLPFSSLFDAAVYFAEFGSPTEPVRYLDMTALNFTSEGRELRQQLLNKSATTFTQQDLAVFLKKVQSEGSSHFYNGSFAQRAVEVTGSYGGNLSLQDFSAYQAALHSDEAVKFAVRGETFALSVQNTNLSFGAVELVEQIHIMAASPLFDAPFTPSAEIPYNGNATQWAWLVEISFWTTIMSDMFLGSAASIRFAAITFNDVFGSVCPELTDATLSDEVVGLRFMQCRQRSALGTAVWRLIESNATSFNARLKSLFGDGKTAQRPRSHSDAVTAVDAEGNFCSVAHSINTGTMWGTGIFVEGVPLSNAGAGGLDRRFIFADDQTSGARFLATPTRPLVVRSVTNPGKGFAFSAIGDSLAEVTLNLLAVLLNEPASVDVVTASPTFLLAAMRPGMPFSVHINMCSNCTTTDPICPQYNARTICATPRFLEQLPAWITPYVLPMYGMDRLKHNGPMAISRRFDCGRRLDASSTPELNGASFGSIWQE